MHVQTAPLRRSQAEMITHPHSLGETEQKAQGRE